VPVCSTDTTSLPHVCISISRKIESKMGELCGRQALKILEDQMNPLDIPIKQFDTPPEITINLENKTEQVTQELLPHILKLNPIVTVALK